MFRLAMGFACLAFLSSCATTPQVSPAVRSDLAPTGKLRAGINLGNAVLTSKNPATGEAGGIAVDMARELGRRLGVPVDLVGYDSGGKTAAGLKTSDWDVAFIAIEPARAAEITYTAAYVEIDGTYLVPAGSPLRTTAEIDREGVRVAVSAGGGNDLFLSRTLQRARLVRAPNPGAAFKLFVMDKLDAYAGLKPSLVQTAETLPGSRVLDGRYTVIQQGIGTPKGRDAGAEYLRQFVEDVKASGLVAQIVDRSGVRGLTVPPPPPTVQIGGGSM